MNRKETLAVMALLRTAYPQYYAKETAETVNASVALWEMMFVDDDFQLVKAAVTAFIATDTKGFPPVIGQIKGKLDMIQSEAYGGGELTPMEAWTKVQRAIKNSYYNSAEEFAKLPDTIRAVIGSPSTLRDYATMDSETVNSVVASNFQRSFSARRDHVVEMRKLPQSVKTLIADERFKAIGAWPEATLALKEGEDFEG
jgi:hypothetical protein